MLLSLQIVDLVPSDIHYNLDFSHPFNSFSYTTPSPADSRRNVLSALHNNAVQAAVAASSDNQLLDGPAPVVNEEELSLPRPARAALSQLRSGYCAALKNYQFRVGRSITASCPLCLDAEHTVAHLFDCPVQPTELTTLDLWSNPVEVANFISSLPFFSHLPSLRRSPTEPPT